MFPGFLGIQRTQRATEDAGPDRHIWTKHPITQRYCWRRKTNGRECMAKPANQELGLCPAHIKEMRRW